MSKQKTGLVIVAAALLLLWLAAFCLTPTVAKWALQGNDGGMSGQFGDMFGAINSLFSGLALVGVVFTVYIQVQEKRKEAKPFVIPHLDKTTGVHVGEFSRRAGEILLRLGVKLKLRNGSADVAVNVRMRAAVTASDDIIAEETAYMDLPIFRSETFSDDVELELSQSGSGASRFVDALDKGQNVLLTLELEYSSTDGVLWRSSVRYNISLNEHRRSEDLAYLREMLGDASGSNAWNSKERLYLECAVANHSWKYDCLS